MPNENDVNYKIPGEKGRCCTDCSEYKPNSNDSSRGDCHGHEVVGKGSCNYFHNKE